MQSILTALNKTLVDLLVVAPQGQRTREGMMEREQGHAHSPADCPGRTSPSLSSTSDQTPASHRQPSAASFAFCLSLMFGLGLSGLPYPGRAKSTSPSHCGATDEEPFCSPFTSFIGLKH